MAENKNFIQEFHYYMLSSAGYFVEIKISKGVCMYPKGIHKKVRAILISSFFE
jgi:hypothetical protein